MKTLILGIGQSMRGDDAAGLEAVRLWQTQHPDSAAQVQVELSELPGLALLNLLEGMDAAILVDAIQSSASAGTVIRLGPDELASFTPDAGSAHGWGVAETLQLGYSLYPSLAKCRVILIGIVGGQFGMGAGLSPVVQKALANAIEMFEIEVRSLR
jgi:hydrogenase maturation protease